MVAGVRNNAFNERADHIRDVQAEPTRVTTPAEISLVFA
jgi:hypothetical protein